MPNPYVGQIIMFGGNFAPQDWALCDGSLLQISEYDQLFSLIGTTYGGDGQTTFALPDLRGRVPIGVGQGPGLTGYAPGQEVGLESVTLTMQQLAPHSHAVGVTTVPGNANTPGNNLLAALGGQAGDGPYQTPAYGGPGDQTQLNAVSVGPAGGGQPHDNRQPYLSLNYCIAVYGTMPQF
jgi:microcystin-dependent protein